MTVSLVVAGPCDVAFRVEKFFMLWPVYKVGIPPTHESTVDRLKPSKYPVSYTMVILNLYNYTSCCICMRDSR